MARTDASGRTNDVTVDLGTSYDFLASLFVLHNPKRFALRGAWTSGMLARLKGEARETLSRAQHVAPCPIHLVPTLPEPKNVETLLWHLAQLEPTERTRQLVTEWGFQKRGGAALLAAVSSRGRWTQADRDQLEELLRDNEMESVASGEKLEVILDVWAHAAAFGEAYLAALRNYYEVFFREEEGRIRPRIEAVAERVTELADRLSMPDLIEEISSGLRFDGLPGITEMVLAPSYWIAPLTLRVRLDEQRMLLVFGGRSATDSIVPGETVPDGLIRALKALSDPTRLRVLRMLSDRSMGASELAKALRLRTPTVLHHLSTLRLAGLIQIRVPETESKHKALFALRPQATHDVHAALESFLHGPEGAGRRDGDRSEPRRGATTGGTR